MRIVELVPTLSIGGAERIAALMSAGLRERGQDVQLVALGPPSGSWIEAQHPATFLHKAPGFDPRLLVRLARLLHGFRPHVVHAHLHVLKYLPPGFRTFHTLHNLAEHEATPADRRLQALRYRLDTTPVAIGNAVADSVLRTYGLRAPTVPNGIPLAPWLGPRIPSATPVFIAAGRLNAQKNHALAIRAVQGLPAQLWIAGAGALDAELRAIAGPNVRFLGVRSDLPALFAQAHALVLPSIYEGNPLVVMEAMAAGLSIVASDVGCVSELVGDAGFLVPPNNVDALRQALLAALEDDRGPVARARATTRFGVDRMVEGYLSLWSSG